ncbi:MAG: hypothetical protein AAFV27_12805, partial [Pseudomonadota bacterium]
MRPVSFALLCALGLSLATGPVLAQDASEEDAGENEAVETPEAEAPAEGTEAAPAEGTEGAAEEPDYNGVASGVFITSPLNVPVLCTGVGSSVINAKSDPGGAPGEDVNGDGTVVDVSATTTGDIQMNMLAGGLSMNFNDSGAVVEGNTVRYAVTASITGGVDEKIELQ